MEPTSKIKTCPLNGKLCVEGIRSDFEFLETAGVKRQIPCQWWVVLQGKDPQSNQVYNEYNCAVPWLVVTSLENCQMTRHVTAQVSEGTKAFVDALPDPTRDRVMERASRGLMGILTAGNVDQLVAGMQTQPNQLKAGS